MKQETKIVGPKSDELSVPITTNESLAALLALAGAKRLDVSELMVRTRLNPSGLLALISWLQREYLVDIVSSLEGNEVRERLELTDKGEQVLIGLLEKMCELPELR
jgi:DNA-binding MarR family transcriptional regulator